MTPLRTRVLRNLKISEVSAVDRGASRGAEIVFMKRQEGTMSETQVAKQAYGLWETIVALAMKQNPRLTKSQAIDAVMAAEPELLAVAKGATAAAFHVSVAENPDVGAVERARLSADHTTRAMDKYRAGVNALVASGMSRSQAHVKAAQDMGVSWADAKNARGV